MRLVSLLSCLLVASACAQPLVYNRGVLNAASFMPQGLASGGIAQGSIFSIFGTRFGPGSPVEASAFPLGTTLGNVSVTLTQGATTVNAIPLYVSNTQVNAIMPSNAPLGRVSLRVLSGALKSPPVPVTVVTSAFGIFTAGGAGTGPGILQNYITAVNQPINEPSIAAQPGQTIILWGTGLGPAPGGADNVAPPVGNLPIKVEVFVGGVPATVAYSGRTPCCSGTDQIVFQVPASAPLGCWVPVMIRTGGTTVGNVVTMAIQSNGTSCADPLNPLSSPLVAGGNSAIFSAYRANTHEDVGVAATVDVTSDYLGGAAYGSQAAPFPFNLMVSLPPAGTCTEYGEAGDLLGGASSIAAPGGQALNFGTSLTLTSPKGTETLTAALGYAAGYLGGFISDNSIPNTLYLNPGAYTLAGTGGADIGAFSASLTVPQALAWTNPPTTVDRTQPLAIAWTGGNPGQPVAVTGFGEDLPTNSSVMFVCLAAPGASNFTIPSVMLSNVPATRANPLQSKDVIYLVSLPGSQVGATGLNGSAVGFTYISGTTVVYQ